MIVAKCPACGHYGKISPRRPLPGSYPMLREFRCLVCHTPFYTILLEEGEEYDIPSPLPQMQGEGEKD